MVPDEDKACLGLEYFCFEGDDLWSMDDDALVELAAAELEQLGSVRPGRVVTGYVVRVPKAYPMYDADYADRVAAISDVARRHRQPAAGRAQRAAPLQQLRPLLADGDPRRRERAHGRRSRHLGRQRGERVPRGGRAG